MPGPDHPKAVAPALRAGVVAALAASALVVPFGLAAGVLGAAGSGDFQWCGARMLAHGVDVYDAALNRDDAGIRLAQDPNYLHLLYFLLLPLGALPFSVARGVWAVLNLLMAGACVVLLGRAVGWRDWRLAGVLGLFFSSTPLVIALMNGQQTLLVLLSSVLAYSLRGPVGQGFWLVVAMTRYSFAPVALGMLLTGRRAALAVSAAVSLLAMAGYLLVTGAGLDTGVLGPLLVGQGMARGSADVMTLTGLLLDDPRSPATYLAALLVGGVLMWLGRSLFSRGHWVDALAGACLVSLVTFPHLLYDYCVLLPVLVSALRLGSRDRWLVLGVVVLFWHNWLIGGLPFAPYHLFGVVLSFGLLVACFGVIVRGAVPSVDDVRAAASPTPAARA